ncbi:hypothetical protein O9929_05230 [Vibrio lentus]|nr:hypothetical protein [Vibrio lentus]
MIECHATGTYGDKVELTSMGISC